MLLGLAVAVKDDAGRYPEVEVAKKPVEMVPTPGFEIVEEVGAKLGASVGTTDEGDTGAFANRRKGGGAVPIRGS